MEMAPEARTTTVVVPVLINTRKIQKGTEVFVRCDPPPPPKKAEPEKKRTWEDDVKSMLPPMVPVKKAKLSDLTEA